MTGFLLSSFRFFSFFSIFFSRFFSSYSFFSSLLHPFSSSPTLSHSLSSSPTLPHPPLPSLILPHPLPSSPTLHHPPPSSLPSYPSISSSDTANKIGTYQLAIAAKYHGVPFFAAVPTTTLDLTMTNGSLIHVEMRPESELTRYDYVGDTVSLIFVVIFYFSPCFFCYCYFCCFPCCCDPNIAAQWYHKTVKYVIYTTMFSNILITIFFSHFSYHNFLLKMLF